MSNRRIITRRTRERLLEEYKVLSEGYNYRDQLVPKEFFNILQIFSILLTISLVVNIIIEFSLEMSVFVNTIFLILGLVTFISLLLDMESTASCKIEIRKRMKEMEKSLGFKYFSETIPKRPKFPEENLLKNELAGLEKEVGWFLNASRLIIVIYNIYMFVLIFFAPRLPSISIPGDIFII